MNCLLKTLYITSILLNKFASSSHFSTNNNNAQVYNPCPSVFQYVNDGFKNFGQIKVPNIFHSSTVNLEVKLSLPAKLPTNYLGELKPQLHDLNAVLNEASRTGTITFNLYFPLYSPLPQVLHILVNGNLICSGPPATGSFVTTIILSHNIFFHTTPANTNNNNQILPANSYGQIVQPQGNFVNNPNILNIGPNSNAFSENLVQNIQVPESSVSAKPCSNEGTTSKRRLYLVFKGKKIQISESQHQDIISNVGTSDAVDVSDAAPVYILEQVLNLIPLNGAEC